VLRIEHGGKLKVAGVGNAILGIHELLRKTGKLL
jgi:hypothetical protein